MKRSLSLHFENANKSRFNEIILTEFDKRITIWGRNSIYDKNNKVFFQNTCTIDYYLLSLWPFSKVSDNFSSYLSDLAKVEKKQKLMRVLTK